MKTTRMPGSTEVRAPRGKGKELIRSLNRGFARPKKRHPVEVPTGRLAEPAVCDGCGAVFAGRVWRRDRPVTGALLARARWMRCPACVQRANETGLGRVVIRGAYALAHEPAIRRRLANVASRAGRTQPERRISSIDRQEDRLDVITTSQKLAHRMVHELKKLFRGRASYAWSDDGTLFATWERDR